MLEYYFYILYSAGLDKYYTGYTSNLCKRLKKHNRDHKGYTGKAEDWEIVYYETYEAKELAYKRERQVKKWKNRIRIKQLIMKHKNL